MEKLLQNLTAEEFALFNSIQGKSDLVSISVRARLTPSESNAAVIGLIDKGLALRDENTITLTPKGKDIKDSKKYLVHGRVGASRLYTPYPKVEFASELSN
jgi:hypothetical protein